MRSRMSRWGLAALVGCFVAIGALITHDMAEAQGRRPVVITRIFTGPDGLSHAEDIELDLNERGISALFKATGAQYSVRPPRDGDVRTTGATDPKSPAWHTGPARQFVITLAGQSELEVADGVRIPSGPGHINLIEDTTGKGHITRNFGPEDRIVLTIPLADGVVIEGTRKPRTK